MKPYVALEASPRRTRVSMFLNGKEVLKANLPPLSKVLHHRAATTFLEALSLWMDAPVYVALSAGDLGNCFVFDLTDELGMGTRSVFYTVEVVPVTAKRPIRIQGVADEAASLLHIASVRGER